ncbi:MAG TPA: N-acetylmuramoyl-L-alanine amidase, partial [Candidatus Sumerlaeota bacterium]|nr:N-acetylmuramoyl-L-alanine amidase [Candidatus Sumerlaeota bacterium]
LDPAPLPLIAPSSHEPEVPALSAMDVTRDIARRVKRILEQDAALDVVLTFDSGEAQDMNERIARINTSGGDILVAIRLDASEFVSLSGTEIFVASSSLDAGAADDADSAVGSRTRPENAWRPHEAAGLALAQSIRAEFNRTFSEADTAVTPAPLFLLRRAAMPSVLITCGYVTNAEDAALLSREGGRETLSDALAGGILKYSQARTQTPSRRMNR